jgi:hypothetical protein
MAEVRIEGVCDGVQRRRVNAGRPKAPLRRLLGQFPCGEGHRSLAVFAAAEPLFLGRRHNLAVDQQRGRRVVKNRVYTQYSHRGAIPP